MKDLESLRNIISSVVVVIKHQYLLIAIELFDARQEITKFYRCTANYAGFGEERISWQLCQVWIVLSLMLRQ
jgi:hypothetical protein